MIPKMVFCKM